VKILTQSTPCVLTIGKFEGIHLGHQALLAEVTHKAATLGIASAAMVFDPHPYAFLKDSHYAPLFTNEERHHILKNTNLDYLIIYPFTEILTKMPPEDFCKIIFETYQAKLLIVGENYRFGSGRTGDTALLHKQAATYGAKLQIVPMTTTATDKISTSHIRRLLSDSKIKETQMLLGFRFFIFGIVSAGKQLGRSLGFPTLNIYPSQEKLLPPDGVYSTMVTVNGTCYRGITNIGLRPTVNSTSTVRSVETHLPDYYGDSLYGEHIKVELLEFIRPERKFDSVEELRIQIAKDIMCIQTYGFANCN